MSSNGMFDDISILGVIGLKEDDTFLDAGCADGHFSLAASRKVGSGGIVYAVDVHSPSLDILEKEVINTGIGNIVIQHTDLRKKLPLMDETLDHYFMSNVMHGFVYNGEFEPVAEEISRLLKKRGKFSLIEWDRENVFSGPPADHRLSTGEAVGLLRPYGLELVKEIRVGPEHILMIFQKTDM